MQCDVLCASRPTSQVRVNHGHAKSDDERKLTAVFFRAQLLESILYANCRPARLCSFRLISINSTYGRPVMLDHQPGACDASYARLQWWITWQQYLRRSWRHSSRHGSLSSRSAVTRDVRILKFLGPRQSADFD